MEQFDVIVIGGGILGCMTARELRRWNISVLLLEKEAELCTGITRANSAIVYPGYDNKPGSRKAAMTVRGNAGMQALCDELEVPFSRCGSLLVTYDWDSVCRLERKLQNGLQNGVPGLRLLSGEEAQEMEPMLKKGVAAALYAPSTGTVNPWKLAIAACENAAANGARLLCNAEVRAIEKQSSGYIVKTTRGTFQCKMICNCAGISADTVQEMVFAPSVRLKLDGAEYLVFDPMARRPGRVIFEQASSCGKGITAIACTEGNLLISGVRKPMHTPFATTPEGLQELRAAAKKLFPELDLRQIIRCFGAVRPNPYTPDAQSLHDFCIEHPASGFYSLIGIKTPGLTCANELGRYLAEQAAHELAAKPNTAFDPHRRAIRKTDDPQIVCRCEGVSKSEILEAIRRGAVTVDGVKRRVGCGMGRCQGARCSFAIEQLLEEARHAAR